MHGAFGVPSEQLSALGLPQEYVDAAQARGEQLLLVFLRAANICKTNGDRVLGEHLLHPRQPLWCCWLFALSR